VLGQAIWPRTNPSCDETKVTDIGAKPARSPAAPATAVALTDDTGAALEPAGGDAGALTEVAGAGEASLDPATNGEGDCGGVAGPGLAT